LKNRYTDRLLLINGYKDTKEGICFGVKATSPPIRSIKYLQAAGWRYDSSENDLSLRK